MGFSEAWPHPAHTAWEGGREEGTDQIIVLSDSLLVLYNILRVLYMQLSLTCNYNIVREGCERREVGRVGGREVGK